MPDGASDILVTKVMLGIFGCVPAFDTYFKKGFGTWTFGRTALMRVAKFYMDNAAVIDRYRVPTLEFDTGREGTRSYSRAKVIDMVFFIEGGMEGPKNSAPRPKAAEIETRSEPGRSYLR